jgi:hypothetical protein
MGVKIIVWKGDTIKGLAEKDDFRGITAKNAD